MQLLEVLKPVDQRAALVRAACAASAFPLGWRRSCWVNYAPRPSPARRLPEQRPQTVHGTLDFRGDSEWTPSVPTTPVPALAWVQSSPPPAQRGC